MSTLVADAIARAGLAEIASARHDGDLARVNAHADKLRGADLLALGALADRVRKDEAGDVVRVYTNAVPDAGPDVVDMHAAGIGTPTGIEFLRAVAIARITGPRAARVRVDWSKVGLELSQVALGFGASELVGPISSKRGLAIADSAEKKVKGQGMVSLQKMKQQEIAGLVRQAGRRVVIVGARGIEIEMSEPEPVVLEPMESQDV
jgi:2-iminoacetate synthase ThiH